MDSPGKERGFSPEGIRQYQHDAGYKCSSLRVMAGHMDWMHPAAVVMKHEVLTCIVERSPHGRCLRGQVDVLGTKLLLHPSRFCQEIARVTYVKSLGPFKRN